MEDRHTYEETAHASTKLEQLVVEIGVAFPGNISRAIYCPLRALGLGGLLGEE